MKYSEDKIDALAQFTISGKPKNQMPQKKRKLGLRQAIIDVAKTDRGGLFGNYSNN